MKYSRYLILLLITLTAGLGCDKDEQEQRFDCGGELTGNPQFVDSLQVEIDTVRYAGSEKEVDSYLMVSTSNPNYVVSATLAYWTISTGDTVSFYNFIHEEDTLISPYYTMFAVGTKHMMDRPRPSILGVQMTLIRDGETYSTWHGNNESGFVKITRRTEPFTLNGDSVVTVECVFCCTTYTADGAKGPLLKGNFRCNVPLES